METRLEARLVTYNDDDVEKPGGMCACCGGGPNPTPDWRRVRPVELEFLAGFATLGDPWYVYRAGICDADGVYYAMLCEGCL